MTQFVQLSNVAPGPGQPFNTALPVLGVEGHYNPGGGWFPDPMLTAFGFVFSLATPAGTVKTVLAANATMFIYIKYLMFKFSVANEMRFQFSGGIVFDFPVLANTVYQIDFGQPGLTDRTVNHQFEVVSPFAVSDIYVNAWGSYSGQ